MATQNQIESIVQKMSFVTINHYLEFLGHKTVKKKAEAQKLITPILLKHTDVEFLDFFHFLKAQQELFDQVSFNEIVENIERDDLLDTIKNLFYESSIGFRNLSLDTKLTPKEVANNLEEILSDYEHRELLDILQEIDAIEFLNFEIRCNVCIKILSKRLGLKFSKTSLGNLEAGIKPSVSSNYNPKLLNLLSGQQKNFCVEKLIDRLRKVWSYLNSPDEPKEFRNYNVLFEGAPGLGKTATANHIASVLGLPFYSISFGSISCGYAGETEARINNFFKDSSKKSGIIFIDEADSLFHTRTSADHSWQISIVNEALQQIEKYPGIVIISTNLLEKLDEATIRRFAEKITFLPLSDVQKAEAFITYFKTDLHPLEVEQLERIGNLNLGDFLCVRKRTFMDNYSNYELIEFLSDEVQFRSEMKEIV